MQSTDSSTSYLGYRILIQISLLAVCLMGCSSSDNSTPSRYYANVPFVLDYPDSLITTQHIGEDSNMLALNFATFYGIPWHAFIDNSAYPSQWKAAIDETEELVNNLGLPVYLALTPLGDDYKTLAPDSVDSNFPDTQVCSDLSARADWDELRIAYADYVDYMVTRFKPRFLALSIELSYYFMDDNNRVDQACLDNWPALRDMFNDIYSMQKTKHPALQIFHTFQIEKMWNADSVDADCFGYVEDCLTEKINLIEDLSMDAFGMSVYPLWSYATHNGSLPDNYLSIFQEKTGLPLVVTETGWQHSPITIDDPVDPGNCIETLYSDESLQSMWMNRLLSEAETLDMSLVVWWSNHDVLPTTVSSNCRCQNSAWCALLDNDPITDFSIRFFGSMGLRDYQGTPRPCLQTWRTAVDTRG